VLDDVTKVHVCPDEQPMNNIEMRDTHPVVTMDGLMAAVVRGWCSYRNQHKTMDLDLAHDIAQEVWNYCHKRLS
jgi:hypothetical protein